MSSLLAALGSMLQTERYRPTRIPSSSGGRHGDALYPRWDSNRAVREGLKVCSLLATCVQRVAERAASVPWYWWEEGSGGKAERKEPVEWLEYPSKNGKVSRFRNMELLVHYMYLSGNGLMGIVWRGGKLRIEPMEVRTENPHGCAPVPDKLRFIREYEWDDSALGGRRRWDADDIIHVIGRPDPANPYWGWSIVEALASTIDLDVEGRRMNLLRFRRMGQPGMIIQDEDLDTDEQRAAAEDKLNQKARGIFGGFLVLGGHQKATPVETLNEEDLGILESIQEARNEIAVACGLHPAMFSNDAATYNNLQNAARLEWQTAVLQNDRIADAVTTHVVKPEDRGRRFIGPSYEGVAVLREISSAVDDMRKLVADCRVATNDAIDALGIPVPHQVGGDEPMVAGNLVLASEVAEGLGDGGTVDLD